MATRKSTAEKREELRQKIAALKAQEQALAARESQDQRKLDTRRKILAGAAALAHAAIDPAFAMALRAALDAVLVKETDRALFKDWLADAPDSAPPPPVPPASPIVEADPLPAPAASPWPGLAAETSDAA